jgi:uncharacterized protein (DUF927 family)
MNFPGSPPTIEDIKKLAQSWLTREIIDAAHIRRVDSETGKALVGRKGRGDFSGLAFPYFLPGKDTVRDYRLRLDNPPLETGKNEKPRETQKYLAPPGRGNLLYFPPFIEPHALMDTSKPILITEGEKKALALSRLAKEGAQTFVAVGLPGVWNWRGTVGAGSGPEGGRRNIKGPIPDLGLIAWEGRAVYVIFDVNAVSNSGVARARRGLALELQSRGAVVQIVDLPRQPGVNGVDDLLAASGPQTVLNLIAQAKPWGPDTHRAFAFQVTDAGVFHLDPDPNKKPVRICSRLEILASTRDEKSEMWGRLLRWRDAEGREHLWAMPMELLAGSGDEYRARLLAGGLEIEPSREARGLLGMYVQSANCDRRACCVSKLGWHGEAFVLPDSTIGTAASGETLVFQSPFESEHFFNIAGSKESWKEGIGRLCSGNSRLVFAVSCAFSAPLLSLSKDECGGFHFHGPSSTGKTTALVVAGSVWGGGARNGFVESWRTTVNGLEAFAESHCDSLGCLDEISQVDAREAHECLYLLANGQGKARMTKALGLRRRLTWTILLLSSGEITLAEHGEHLGKRTKVGAEIRLVNIPVDAGAGMGIFESLHGFQTADGFARHLKDAAKSIYGGPIRALLEFVVANRIGVEDRIKNLRANFLEQHLPPNSSAEVMRAAGRFALAGIAGDLATEVGLTGWQPGEATTAAACCLSEWILARGTVGSGEVEAALRQVRAFIEAHGASRFQSVHPRLTSVGEEIPERVPNRAGFKREDAKGQTEYLVLPEVFRTEVCAGFDYRIVARALADRGYLVCESGRLMLKPRLPELGTAWVYAIRSRIVEG